MDAMGQDFELLDYNESGRNSVIRFCVNRLKSAGLQALCSYKELELYTFFFASDLVDGVVWGNVNLGTEEERKMQINCFEIALKLAELT